MLCSKTVLFFLSRKSGCKGQSRMSSHELHVKFPYCLINSKNTVVNTVFKASEAGDFGFSHNSCHNEHTRPDGRLISHIMTATIKQETTTQPIREFE